MSWNRPPLKPEPKPEDLKLGQDVYTCWCGHLKSQHGPRTYTHEDYPDGIYREDACLVCDGRCDEWQPEHCSVKPWGQDEEGNLVHV